MKRTRLTAIWFEHCDTLSFYFDLPSMHYGLANGISLVSMWHKLNHSWIRLISYQCCWIGFYLPLLIKCLFYSSKRNSYTLNTRAIFFACCNVSKLDILNMHMETHIWRSIIRSLYLFWCSYCYLSLHAWRDFGQYCPDISEHDPNDISRKSSNYTNPT